MQGVGGLGPLRLCNHFDVNIVPCCAFLERLLLHPADDDFRRLVIVFVDQPLNPPDFGFDRAHLGLTALRLVLGQGTGMDVEMPHGIRYAGGRIRQLDRMTHPPVDRALGFVFGRLALGHRGQDRPAVALRSQRV